MCLFNLRACLNDTGNKTSSLQPELFLDLKLALRVKGFQNILQGYSKSIDAMKEMLAVTSAVRRVSQRGVTVYLCQPVSTLDRMHLGLE